MIAAMAKVLVAGRALDRRGVLEAVRRAGVVHVEPVDRREMIALPAVKEEQAMAGRALDILDATAAAAVACPPEHTPPVAIARVLALSSALEATRVRRQDLLRERQQAAPWGRLWTADLQALLTAGLRVEFFTCPAGAAGLVQAEVRHLAGRVKDQEHRVGVSRGEIVITAPAVRVPIPDRDAAAIDAALEALDAEQGRLGSELAAMKPCGDDLRQYRVHLQDQQRLLEVESGLHDAGEIFVLKGWVPSRDVRGLAAALNDLAVPTGLRVSPPDEADQPPTRFENRAWCRPIENLYRLLGLFPGYREKDISFLFLPALTVFAGFLIADAGYAACALLALGLSYRPLVRRGAPGAVLNLALYLCGGVLVFGALTNTWFGERLLRLTPFDGATDASQNLLKRLCFLLGAVHLSLAHLLKIWGKPLRLKMLAEAGWILFIWAMLALINMLVLQMPAPPWMTTLFQISLALVLLFTAPSRNPLKALGAGLGAIALNAAAFLSDIISYIRLWAVGLAGGILAASFNELAGDLPLAVMILVLVPAHLLNLSLGLVAIFAHGVRLNLLEFSNHLGMEWSGREYDPFRAKAVQ